MRDDRRDVEIVGFAVQVSEARQASVTGALSSDERPIHVIGQPWGHRLGVALSPVGDELTNDGCSRRVSAVSGKNSFHGLSIFR